MSAGLQLVPPPELEGAAMGWPEQAEALQVVDQASHTTAAECLLSIAGLERQIKSHHAPLKADAHALHKRICDAENRLLEPLTRARRLISPKLSGYEAEQRRIQQELQRKADEAAAQLANEMALEQAALAEQAGASEEVVTQILEAPPVYVAPVVAPTFQKAKGISTPETWHAELTSIKKLCEAVILGAIPENAVTANMVWLNARARSDKENFNVPGAKAVKEIGVRVRR